MSWKILTSDSIPPSRAAHSCDEIDSKLYIFGGWNGTKALNDLYILEPDKMQWTQAIQYGDVPSERNNHATSVIGTRLLVHGGHDGTAWRDDMFILDTMTMSWSKCDSKGNVPSPRACHTMNKIGSKLYLFGGYDGTTCFNELIAYKTESKTWSVISPKSSCPTARNAHTMTTKGSTLILFGGHTGKKHLNDVWIFNIEDESWTEISTTGNPPKGLRAHSSNLVGNKLFVFGGYDGTRRSNLMMILDLEKMKWDKPSFEDLTEAPTGRQRHSATLINTTKILLFGGFDGSKWLNDSYQIDISHITFLSKQSQNVKQMANNFVNNLFNKPELSDFCFVVDGKPIFAHKAILASQSDHFNALFTSGMKESQGEKIVVNDWSFDQFYHMIKFFYSGTLSKDLDVKQYTQILQISDAHSLPDLKSLCEQLIVTKIDLDNACDLLELAHKFQAYELKSYVMNFIISNFSHIYGTKHYEGLEKNPSLLIELTRNVFSSMNVKTFT